MREIDSTRRHSMYRTNFYGQIINPLPLSAKSLHGNNILSGLPEVPHAGVTFFASDPDGFTKTPTAFERSFHQEMTALNQRKSQLDTKVKEAKPETMTHGQQQSLMYEATLIERTKEMLSYIVEHMQKCAAAIVSNFR